MKAAFFNDIIIEVASGVRRYETETTFLGRPLQLETRVCLLLRHVTKETHNKSAYSSGLQKLKNNTAIKVAKALQSPHDII